MCVCVSVQLHACPCVRFLTKWIHTSFTAQLPVSVAEGDCVCACTHACVRRTCVRFPTRCPHTAYYYYVTGILNIIRASRNMYLKYVVIVTIITENTNDITNKPPAAFNKSNTRHIMVGHVIATSNREISRLSIRYCWDFLRCSVIMNILSNEETSARLHPTATCVRCWRRPSAVSPSVHTPLASKTPTARWAATTSPLGWVGARGGREMSAELVKIQNLCTWVNVQVTHKKATQVEVKVLNKNCTWSTSKK